MMKLLMTGATGFVGSNILPILSQQYEVTTLGRSKENQIIADLSIETPKLPDNYDIVLHAAGKVHTYPKTEAEIQEYYDVNYQGTMNLCCALESTIVPQTIIYLSSAAVYGLDRGEGINEDHPLDAKTPYARSKKMAEEYLQGWCSKHHVRLSILRPSLIAGPNPSGNLGSMIKGIASGYYFSIAGGKARKSVLMVQDIAFLISLLEKQEGIYNICSDDQPSFRDLESIICKGLNKKMPSNIPMWSAFLLAKIGDVFGKKFPFNSKRLTKMTESLTFSNDKVKKELGWVPLSIIDHFVIA